MLNEEPPQLALPNAETFRQSFYVRALGIQRSVVDQSQRPGNRVRSSAPGGKMGSSLRPASQARPKSRFLCCRRGSKKPAVHEMRRTCGTDRPAINSRRCHADKDQSVEPGIAAL